MEVSDLAVLNYEEVLTNTFFACTRNNLATDSKLQINVEASDQLNVLQEDISRLLVSVQIGGWKTTKELFTWTLVIV